MKFYSLVLIFIIASLFSATSTCRGESTSSASDVTVETLLKKMSLRQKAGQLIFLGFNGVDFSSDLEARLKTVEPGGILFFSRNISNLKDAAGMISRAQALSKELSGVPLLIGVDQEGGSVVRVKGRSLLPSAYTIGRTEDPALAENLGYETGRILASLGFNMNFAPVLDLSDPHKKSFIGSRSFGKDPQKVAEISLSFSRGLESGGVIPTAKHFPGQGNVTTDPHSGLPVKLTPLDELLATDLVPFQSQFTALPTSAVMVAHMALPKLDSSGLPATYSKEIMTTLIREKMKFQGIIITDDLQMAGAARSWSTKKRAVKSFLAGADMLMIVWSVRDQAAAVNGILEGIKSGEISIERLNQSVRRILLAKISADQTKTRLPDIKLAETPELIRHVRTVVTRIITEESQRVGLSTHIFPRQRVRVVSSSAEFLASARRSPFSNDVSFLGLVRNSEDMAIKALSYDKKELIVVYLSGKVSRHFVSSLPPEIRKRTLLINPDVPAATLGLIGFKGILHIGTRGPDSGELLLLKIGEYLSGSKDSKTAAAFRGRNVTN